ncbi:hypothetical protein AB4270_05425 [Vibrio cyclitrophicus]
MASLRINKINYYGEKYYFESNEFDTDIVLIEADNGTGKTTLNSLIYFCLGGKVKHFDRKSEEPHEQIAYDKNNYAELYISINEDNFLLRREISQNEILVAKYVNNDSVPYFSPEIIVDTTEIYKIIRKSNSEPPIFSDWILNKLNIDVVSLSQGSASFKFNFSDLLRLIYHNQLPDPSGIYKPLDNKTNFLTDSELIRKAIFELLLGNQYSDFYTGITKEREAEKEYQISKNVSEEYRKLVDSLNELSGNIDVLNIDTLKSDLSEKETRLSALLARRDLLTKQVSPESLPITQIDILKNEISLLEQENIEMKHSECILLKEAIDLKNLIKIRNQDVKNIEKIIHTHNKLSLFNSKTCPYCLEEVELDDNHCICGNPVDEMRFERFTYTSNEYVDILKSRIKSRETIFVAYEACLSELDTLKQKLRASENKTYEIKNRINEKIESSGKISPSSNLQEIDSLIFELKDDISKINQRLTMEEKLLGLINKSDNLKDKFDHASSNRKLHESKAELDMQFKLKAFNSIYNELMTESLDECRTAKISSENYMPIINGGTYKEASSKVSVRLMYYLTLLKMSLTDSSVTFPKFLLVDTPETAGIEEDNLMACLEKLTGLTGSYQIILSTGLGKYPKELLKYRKLYLPNKTTKLLKLRV